MIISHKHKFIFLKTRKTAGTSIEIALSQICGKEDIITPISPKDEEVRKELGFPTAQNFTIPSRFYSKLDWVNFFRGRRPKYYNHMPANELVNYIDKNIWDTYYKFSIDRNPFDKVVSGFFYKGGFNKYSSVLDYLKEGNLNNARSYEIYSLNKIVAVDDVFKYEEMDKLLSTVSLKLSLAKTLVLPEYRAKGNLRPEKDYKKTLDEISVEIIKIALAREIQYLGYQY